jgi:serine/threonine protein kinase
LPAPAAQFRQGVLAAQQLNHENVVNIRELRVENGTACTIMDYVDGAPLTQSLGQPMPLDRVKAIAAGLASGLSYAHGHGVIHCNLRASCILLGPEDRPVIFDFGRALVTGLSGLLSEGHDVQSDPLYVAPEQCEGEPSTTRSDQYALGVILYEMLTGVPPFTGKTAYRLMHAHCHAEPVLVSERRKNCPPQVCATVMRLLRKDPSQRYSRTSLLLDEIHAWPTYERVSIPGNSGDREQATARALALASYDRCIARDALLIDKLYDRLREQEELRPHLATLNFDSQVKALRRGIPRLLSFSEDDASARAYLDWLVERHRPLGLQARHFEAFCDVLVALIEEIDPLPTPLATEERLDALRRVLAPTLSRMSELSSALVSQQAPPTLPIAGASSRL